MPRVLQILNRSSIGGPVVIASLLTRYMPSDFETLLLAGNPTESEKQATELLDRFGIQPVYMPKMGRELNPFNDWVAYKKIKRIIQDFKPDIVHTHSAKPGVIGRLAASSLNVPVVLHTFHGHVFHSYFSAAKTRFFINVERYLATKSTKIIAISPLQKKELAEEFRIAPADKIEVVPIGLYLEPFQANTELKRKKFRDEFQIDDDTIVISIVGRLAPVKNHRLFIKAIAELVRTTQKKFKAFIVGDGECRHEILNFCRQYGLSFSLPDHPDFDAPVIFTSWRTDVDVVNAGSDIITLTSLNEGTPVSLIEAQASGKPIVATNCGGMADAVLENETALLSEANDDVAFYNNLRLMVEDDQMRNQFGMKGPHWASKQYGHENLIDATQELYLRLLSDNSLFAKKPQLFKAG